MARRIEQQPSLNGAAVPMVNELEQVVTDTLCKFNSSA